MRKIVANMFVSLDGVVEAPETFTGPYFHPEVGQQIQAGFEGSDTLLLGRVTYQTTQVLRNTGRLPAVLSATSRRGPYTASAFNRGADRLRGKDSAAERHDSRCGGGVRRPDRLA
jgi:hypothetical protein